MGVGSGLVGAWAHRTGLDVAEPFVGGSTRCQRGVEEAVDSCLVSLLVSLTGTRVGTGVKTGGASTTGFHCTASSSNREDTNKPALELLN
ncbi:hypothetical protein [Synechococcus sp. UW140]|uniref:hypothetical protein n=1 Tax=Synechococcus sp. UW140 TaxID=368503 RepID=UPI003137F473